MPSTAEVKRWNTAQEHPHRQRIRAINRIITELPNTVESGNPRSVQWASLICDMLTSERARLYHDMQNNRKEAPQ